MTTRERGYLIPGLQPDERRLLDGVPREATLAEEIAYLRLRILRLATANQEKDGQLLVRMLELLTKMVNAQVKLGASEDDGLAELNELVRRRLTSSVPSEECRVKREE